MNTELVQILSCIRSFQENYRACFGVTIDAPLNCGGVSCSYCPCGLNQYGDQDNKNYGYYLLSTPVREL